MELNDIKVLKMDSDAIKPLQTFDNDPMIIATHSLDPPPPKIKSFVSALTRKKSILSGTTRKEEQDMKRLRSILKMSSVFRSEGDVAFMANQVKDIKAFEKVYWMFLTSQGIREAVEIAM
jgi:hypothetical protein